jgi:8-oxo-dGTP pyrophosphatase MutT (NUDIX family)
MLLNRRTVYDGRVISVTIDTVELPNTTRLPLEIIHHPGGAAIAAIDAERRICMLRQYRHAAGGYIWELPAGKLESGEAPLKTAQRELAEEAARAASNWRALGDYVSSPGVFNEVVYLFLATDLTPAEGAAEAGEVFDVHWWPLDIACERALNNELRDGKTALGVLRAAAALTKA